MDSHDGVSGTLPGDLDAAPLIVPSLGPLRYLHAAVEFFVIALFVAIVGVAVLTILNRFFLGASLPWSEEFQRYGHIWLVLFAISIACRRGAHIGVDLIQTMAPARIVKTLGFIIDLGWLTLGVLLLWSVSKLLGITSRQLSPGIGLHMSTIYFGFVLGGGYMIVCAVERLLLRLMGRLER